MPNIDLKQKAFLRAAADAYAYWTDVVKFLSSIEAHVCSASRFRLYPPHVGSSGAHLSGVLGPAGGGAGDAVCELQEPGRVWGPGGAGG